MTTTENKKEPNEVMKMIQLLLQLNQKTIMDKLEGNTDNEEKNFQMLQRVAEELSEDGVGNFDFTSKEKFEKSLNAFLNDFN